MHSEDSSEQAPRDKAEVMQNWKKPFINEKQIRTRLRTVKNWSKIIFSDESNFQHCPTSGHLTVRQ